MSKDRDNFVYEDPDLPKFERFHREKSYGYSFDARGKKPREKNKRDGKKDKRDIEE
jgi:hypothetical protein